MARQHKLYRIGVDVGGTNTDSALACSLNPVDGQKPQVEIVASCKTPTTSDVTTGICTAISSVLETADAPPSDVLSINIGTTHFINAVVQADAEKLCPVAVLRLCGPFCREVPPFADFPRQLRAVVEGYTGYLSGGLELDGRRIAEVNEEEVIEHAQRIKESGIQAVVVIGVFSSVDTADATQEEHVKRLLETYVPGVDVVCSRDIGGVGFIERENASILNASMLEFGRKTIHSFEMAIAALGIDCPVYLTQNDGTVIDMHMAARTPIKTFSSGATNSLSGAVFLSRMHQTGLGIDLKTSQVIMVDIGGTTSDLAALSPSGFPRQSPAVVRVGGVRTAFRMPEVLSIGLGGGSYVGETENGDVHVGPLSVGNMLPYVSRCFGGPTLTATDIVAASDLAGSIGTNWEPDVPHATISKARHNIKRQLERAIESMKTSDRDVILLLVGGGSFIQMDQPDNVKQSIRPPFYDVANAVGAAIAKISGEIDRIEIPGSRSQAQIMDDLQAEAIQLTCHKGALPESVKIVESETIPLQYVTNLAFRATVKAVGELGWEGHSPFRVNGFHKPTLSIRQTARPCKSGTHVNGEESTTNIDLNSYQPEVSENGEWFVSEQDLAFIAEGVGILGTGGGGSVHSAYLHSLEVLRTAPKGRLRIIDPGAVPADCPIACVAYAGAPSVSNERLIGDDELRRASETLAKYLGIHQYGGVVTGEIGGSNGMRPFAMAASMDIPVVDADPIGRAFPKIDMALPYVYGAATPSPGVLSDPRGIVQLIASVDSARRFEDMVRSTSVELGLYTALSLVPFSLEVLQKYCCHRSLSTAWFLGRAVYTARQNKSDVVQTLVAVIPGCQKLYTGKIVNVSREVKGGWTVGTATLEPSIDQEDDSNVQNGRTLSPLPLILQYQNEFLAATLHDPNMNTQERLCTTPDLITVLDQDGTALATHELRYGLLVSVIGMPAHPLWTSPTATKASDPASFGLDGEYQPLSRESWREWPSVIETFRKKGDW